MAVRINSSVVVLIEILLKTVTERLSLQQRTRLTAGSIPVQRQFKVSMFETAAMGPSRVVGYSHFTGNGETGGDGKERFGFKYASIQFWGLMTS